MSSIATERTLEEKLDAIAPWTRRRWRLPSVGSMGLTKLPGSLGRLEELAVWLAGVTGRPDARVDRPAIIVAAAEPPCHGAGRVGLPVGRNGPDGREVRRRWRRDQRVAANHRSEA